MSHKKKLTELFQEVRNRDLNEEFQVGQAAHALFELQKSAKQYAEWLEKYFNPQFKKIVNDPRNDELVNDLQKQLQAQIKELQGVAKEVDEYLDDYQLYVGANSNHRDSQRGQRWSRWEHRTPRHVQRAQDKEDGL